MKDWALQADQQLYPLIELLDYRDLTGSWPADDDATGWGQLVRQLWTALPRDPAAGCWSATRIPADDPDRASPAVVDADPLLARRPATAAHAAGLGVDDVDVSAEASRIRDAVLDSFSVAGPLGTQWAYVARCPRTTPPVPRRQRSARRFAPCLGFVTTDDPVWQATMQFAFSS